MALMVFNLPVTNTLAWPIRLYNGGGAGPGLLTLLAGAATVLNLTFDRIRVVTATLPHHTYVQNPNVAIVINPPGLGFFRTGPFIAAAGPHPPGPPGQQTYVLTLGAPSQNAVTYTFS